MNIRIIFPVLFLLVLVTSIGNITAQEDALTSNEAKPSVQIIQGEKFPFYAFVQIIHRDSDGNLLAYIESDKISTFDKETITELMDLESSLGTDPIYLINANQVQVIVRQHVTEVETITCLNPCSATGLWCRNGRVGDQPTYLRDGHGKKNKQAYPSE